MLNLKQYDHSELDNLEGDILELYKKLSASTYLKDVEITELVKESFEKLIKDLDGDLIAIVDKSLMMMNGLLSLGIKFTTYASFERRFDLFLTTLCEYVIILLDEDNARLELKEKHAITESLILLFLRYLTIEKSVWYHFLSKWFILNENEEWIEPYYRYFQQLHQDHDRPFQLSIITSLLALICLDGVGSLTYLKLHKQRITANDLYYHFTLLYNRQEWDTMQSWFELFTASWNGHLGNLQYFYNSLLKDKKNSFDFTNHLAKWLNRPTLQSYIKLSKSIEGKDRSLLFKKVKENLGEQLSYPTIQKLYIEIILYEQKWEEAIYYFLNEEPHPFQLSDEKQQLLEQLEKQLPERTIPIYHQFIVRLVEKKMRSHYSDAVQFMKKLKLLYERTNQLERFYEFISMFNQTYKTYRALIQEMKTIDE
ncbi:hypothetical protein [Alkalihalobacillus sp. BA299]|uniref:hypothetical protein n=1 Tax=Alkalihalobacillus sp. BA299 TaxID=2815938 RepID=UPI001ADBF56B|nr:hypothetical protein [Alkalihalobacillus sp. BA299]